MRDTSIQTYKELYNEGKIGKRQAEVLKALERLRYATDSEIAHFLGYSDINMIRPRRKELFDLGIICEYDKAICKMSGRTAIRWEINRGDKKKTKDCISNASMNNIRKLISEANDFQRDTIKRWLDGKEKKDEEEIQF
jgi:hypothetical protein